MVEESEMFEKMAINWDT